MIWLLGSGEKGSDKGLGFGAAHSHVAIESGAANDPKPAVVRPARNRERMPPSLTHEFEQVAARARVAQRRDLIAIHGHESIEHEKTETARGLHDLPPPCVAHAGHPAKVFARDKAPRESEGIVVGHAQYPTR